MVKKSKLLIVTVLVILAAVVLMYILWISLQDTQSQGSKKDTSPVVDTIPCQSTEMVSYHIHSHLVIYNNGSPVLVPAGIGIGKPWSIASGGFIQGGSCFYWIHTHDTSGVIHIEAPGKQKFTLGQFFDIWGQPLTGSNIAGYSGKVSVYVNQKLVTIDPRTVSLKNHENITLEVGKTATPAANFDFSAAGL